MDSCAVDIPYLGKNNLVLLRREERRRAVERRLKNYEGATDTATHNYLAVFTVAAATGLLLGAGAYAMKRFGENR